MASDSEIDDDSIHEITLLAAYNASFTVGRIRIEKDFVIIYDTQQEVLKISKEELSQMTISELGKRLTESASKEK